MKITSVKNEKELVSFEIDLSEKKWNEFLDKEILKASKNLKMPGYRPGKVPLEIAKKNINMPVCFVNALSSARERIEDWIIDQDEFKKMADEICDFDPVTSKPNNSNNVLNKTVSFTMSFGKYPEFKVKNVKDIKIEKIESKVNKQMVDQAIEKELAKNETMSVKERAAKLNDIVIIDFKGYVDNVAFEGGEAKNYELKLGSKSFIDNFEEQLVGLKAGDKKDVNVTFPKDYHVANLKGKKAKFEVTVHVVNEVETPKLDDEFVKSLNLKNVNTVAEYKKHLEAELQKQLDGTVDNQIQSALYTELNKMVPSDLKIHEGLVNNVAEIFISRLMISLIGKVVNIDEFVKMIDGGRGALTKEKLIEEEKNQAREYLKVKFVLKQYSKVEKISVSNEDIEKEIKEIAANSNTKEKEIKEDFAVYSSIKREALDKKVFEYLKNQVAKAAK
ncbi:trigger factor [Malacoplasma penetrans]|uniref:trigger factor n=1 Tax=Malacoplasma penetrans TaxID=28227 RepID=UPI001010935C|nr:trigger factor [Malacoplasma penetrans]RXY96250.1 trigger factor [Malacoplasma penetrans]